MINLGLYDKDFIASFGGKRHNDLWLLTPTKPLTIKVKKLRENGSILTELYHGEDLIIEEDLATIERALNILARNITKQE